MHPSLRFLTWTANDANDYCDVLSAYGCGQASPERDDCMVISKASIASAKSGVRYVCPNIAAAIKVGRCADVIRGYKVGYAS